MWRKWAFRNENPSVEIKTSMDGLNASFDIAHGGLERGCISRSYSRSGKNQGDEESLQSKDQRGQLGVRTKGDQLRKPYSSELLKLFPLVAFSPK